MGSEAKIFNKSSIHCYVWDAEVWFTPAALQFCKFLLTFNALFFGFMFFLTEGLSSSSGLEEKPGDCIIVLERKLNFNVT